MAVSRILLTGDLLRPDPADPARSESRRRIQWFEDLLAPALAQVTDLPVARVAAEGEHDLVSLYRDAGLTPSLDTWAALYAGDLPPRLESRLLDLFQDAVVIGMETPPSIARVLHGAGIPLIDGIVDPVRFLDDIPLSWRTPDAAVAARLEPFRLAPFDITRRVALIRAKNRWMPPLDVPAGATLVLDQMASDSAVIDPVRGRRVSWDDYGDVLASLRSGGPLLWRPHPHSLPHPVLEAAMRGVPKATDHFYRLLGTEAVREVVAISSGGVIEARHFGKTGRHLLDRYEGITVPGWRTLVPVVGHWVSPHFWRDVLRPLLPTRDDVPCVPCEKNFFRRSINCDWGFTWMDQVVAEAPRPAPARPFQAQGPGGADSTASSVLRHANG